MREICLSGSTSGTGTRATPNRTAATLRESAVNSHRETKPLRLFSTLLNNQNVSFTIGLPRPFRDLGLGVLRQYLEMDLFMREDVIHAVEAHLNGLGARDISASPFHQDIEFVDLLALPLKEHPRCVRFSLDFSQR